MKASTLSCSTGAALSFVTAALLCLLLSASSVVRAGKDDLPNPGWSNACSSAFQVCSKVETYRYWSEKPGERLSFWVEGLTKDINNKDVLTLWLLMDELDAEFAKEFGRADFNVMLVHPRGTKASTTHFTCADADKEHTDQCWISEKCAAEVAAQSAAKDSVFNASHFSADQVAHDVEFLMRTLGEGRKNLIITQGLSSVFATRLLQLHPKVPVGVIMMDYVHPLLFDTYGYLGGVGHDVALQHVLTLCDDDVACAGRLGAVDGAWNRLQTLMALAKSKKLTCAKELEWDSNKALGSSFADQLRSILALMLRYPIYPFKSSNTDLVNLIPSMLYRLQRCAEKDIKPLNALYTYVSGKKGYACPDDLVVQTHWLMNEFLQAAPPKSVEKYWAGEAGRRVIVPPVVHVNEFHTGTAKFPLVARTPSSLLLPVNATQKVLFLGADVDPMAPRGAASQAAISFRRFGSSVKAVLVRGIANAPAAVLTPCILNNLKIFAARGDWAEPDVCTIDQKKKIDFLGGPTKAYYGVDDAWDYDQPNSDDGSSRSGGGGGGSHGSVLKSIFRVLLILIVIAAVGAGGYFGYNYLKARGFRYNRVSDNFYDNLQT